MRKAWISARLEFENVVKEEEATRTPQAPPYISCNAGRFSLFPFCGSCSRARRCIALYEYVPKSVREKCKCFFPEFSSFHFIFTLHEELQLAASWRLAAEVGDGHLERSFRNGNRRKWQQNLHERDTTFRSRYARFTHPTLLQWRP